MKNSWNRWIYTCWAPFYDGLIGIRPLVEARRRTLERLRLQAGERVLIVGIGTGADLPLLPRGVHVLGIDLSRSMLRRAQAKLGRAPEPTQLAIADAQLLPFGDGVFDAVVLNLILSVVPDGSACLREVARVTRAEARVVVLDKFLSSLKPPLWRRMANGFTRVFGTDINRRLEDLLSGSGWRITAREAAAFRGAYVLVELRHEFCTASGDAVSLQPTEQLES